MRLKIRTYLTGYLFVLPLLVVLFGLIIYPLFLSGYISLTDFTLGLQTKFIGLKNYVQVIQTSVFRRTIYNTFLFSALSTVFRLILGLAMALALNQAFKFRGFLRGFFLLPWVVPTVVVCLIWFWVFNDMLGVVNYFLQKVGMEPVAWLAEPHLALFSVTFVNVWRGFPFFGICLLAGLQTIPSALYEAADVDGASAVRKFVHITIPMLMPVIMVTTLLSFIWAFNEFQLVFLLTRGGPANLTQIIGIYSYYTGIQGLQFGVGTAISLVSFPVLAIVVVVMSIILKRGENE